jgi:hypothetical protein
MRELLQSLFVAINCPDKESARLMKSVCMSHDLVSKRANFCSITTSPFLARFLKVYTGWNDIRSALTTFWTFRTCQVFICRRWNLPQVIIFSLLEGPIILPMAHALTSSCSLSGTA